MLGKSVQPSSSFGSGVTGLLDTTGLIPSEGSVFSNLEIVNCLVSSTTPLITSIELVLTVLSLWPAIILVYLSLFIITTCSIPLPTLVYRILLSLSLSI